ncbi:unnamed protein product [Mycena citricolor]|uniref:Uncharacterized protein n=1 Tax=Mycena citricolor TaxID=2018698 RepID=A0AAD2HNU9_9AGAR|nr:unnamed protein product [Mycena citricolor]
MQPLLHALLAGLGLGASRRDVTGEWRSEALRRVNKRADAYRVM